MKKMKRAQKLMAVLLSICMLSSLCVVGANAEGTTTNVAKIGDTEYATLAEAVTAANSGSDKTITLQNDIVVSTDTTYDFSGLTIQTVGHKFHVQSGALTIAGNGTVNNAEKGTTTDRKGMFLVDAGASLTIKNGTYTSKAAEIVKTLGTATVENGTFTCDGNQTNEYDSWCIMVANGESATLTVEAGTLTATSGTDYSGMNGVYALNGGSIVLGKSDGTGPSIKTDYAAIGANNTTATCKYTIYGGNYAIETLGDSNDAINAYHNKYNAVVYMPCNGVYNISGGTFGTSVGTKSHVFSVPYNNTHIEANITGGNFSSTGDLFYIGDEIGKYGATGGNNMSISGGKFSADPSNYVCLGSCAIKNAGADKATYPWIVNQDGAATVKLTDGSIVHFVTLKKAISAAGTTENGKTYTNTVTLQADVNEDIQVGADKNVVLDLNGHTLTNATGSADTITVANGGTLIVTNSGTGDAGKVANNGMQTAALLNNGTATLSSGTFERTNASNDGATRWYAVQNHGNMIISGATIKQCSGVIASALINGWAGYVEKDTYSNGEKATMRITSGTVMGGEHAVKQCADAKGGSTFTITGGIFTPISGKDALTADATVSVEGGTFNGNMTSRNGGTINISNGYINGGLFCDANKAAGSSPMGDIAISGGYFTAEPVTMLALDHTYSTGKWKNSDTADNTNYIYRVTEISDNAIISATGVAYKDSTTTGTTNVTVTLNGVTLTVSGKIPGDSNRLDIVHTCKDNSSVIWTTTYKIKKDNDNTFIFDGEALNITVGGKDYTVTLGDLTAMPATVAVQEAAPTAETTIPKTDTQKKAAADAVITAITAHPDAVTSNGLDAAVESKIAENDNNTSAGVKTNSGTVIASDSAATREALSAASLTLTNAQKVVVVAQPYLDIKIADVTLDGNNQVTALKLDIEPKYVSVKHSNG